MLCNLLSLLYIIHAEVSEWQTSKIQILVWVTTCGFKSHLLHSLKEPCDFMSHGSFSVHIQSVSNVNAISVLPAIFKCMFILHSVTINSAVFLSNILNASENILCTSSCFSIFSCFSFYLHTLLYLLQQLNYLILPRYSLWIYHKKFPL